MTLIPTFCSTPTHSSTRRLTLSACAGSANRSVGIRSNPQHPRAVLWSILPTLGLPAVCAALRSSQHEARTGSLARGRLHTDLINRMHTAWGKWAYRALVLRNMRTLNKSRLEKIAHLGTLRVSTVALLARCRVVQSVTCHTEAQLSSA